MPADADILAQPDAKPSGECRTRFRTREEANVAERAMRAADELERLEARRIANALERLQDIYEPIRLRRDRLDAGLTRIDGLRATMIAQLDAIEGDADFEPVLCHAGALGSDAMEWLEHDPADLGEPDADGEPSLCGITFGLGNELDKEGDGYPDDEPDLSWGLDRAEDDQRGVSNMPPQEGDGNCDDEPSLTKLDIVGGSQVGMSWVGNGPDDDREDDAGDLPEDGGGAE